MATSHTRWDPVRDLIKLRPVMDRLLDPDEGRHWWGRSNEDLELIESAAK